MSTQETASKRKRKRKPGKLKRKRKPGKLKRKMPTVQESSLAVKVQDVVRTGTNVFQTETELSAPIVNGRARSVRSAHVTMR